MPKNHAKDTEMATSFLIGDNKKDQKQHQQETSIYILHGLNDDIESEELNDLKDELAYKLRPCNIDIVNQKKYNAIGDLSSRKTVIYDEIIEKKEQSPIIFIGYSSGGLLALKVAHKLQKRE